MDTLFTHYCMANYSRTGQSLPVSQCSWISLCPGSSGSIAGVGSLNSTVSEAQLRTRKLLGGLECLEVKIIQTLVLLCLMPGSE